MRPGVPEATFRVVVVLAAAVMGGLAGMGWLYVEATWIRYLTSIAFGGLALFFVATLFSRPAATAALGGTPRGAVVMSRTPGDSGGGRIHLLLGDTEQVDVSADAGLFEMLSPGDAGIATTSGVPPALDLHSFRRLK